MPISATSLITLTSLKSYIGQTDTAYDTILETIIDAVSDMFSKYLGRQLAKTTYTDEYYDGSGMPDLLLPNYPIVSVTSLAYDTNLLTEGILYDYILYGKQGRIYLNGGSWLESPKVVKMTYVAGYVVQGGTIAAPDIALPNDLALACKMQCATEWKRHQQKDWGEMSRSFPDGSISNKVEDAFMPQVEAILKRYCVMGE